MRASLVFVAAALVAAAAGAQIPLPDPAIAGFSSEFVSWEATFALDDNIDTDWASDGDGTNAYIDFNFGSPVLITQIRYTDRRNAGGPNGAPVELGCSDDVFGYNLIFSTDSTFGNPGDVTQSVSSSVCPTFVDLVAINGGTGYLAQYVRFDVTSTDGGAPNNGGAEFDFFTVGAATAPAEVPTASTWVLLALIGALLMFAVARLR